MESNKPNLRRTRALAQQVSTDRGEAAAKRLQDAQRAGHAPPLAGRGRQLPPGLASEAGDV